MHHRYVVVRGTKENKYDDGELEKIYPIVPKMTCTSKGKKRILS